ncbi:MAG: hypothetical protein Q8M95_02865 [Candidatus Methanoperedens sp.]|nr:hypothetical protein [Candidatus Methanoperedens sp.]
MNPRQPPHTKEPMPLKNDRTRMPRMTRMHTDFSSMKIYLYNINNKNSGARYEPHAANNAEHRKVRKEREENDNNELNELNTNSPGVCIVRISSLLTSYQNFK